MSLKDRFGAVFKGRDEFDLTSGSVGKPLFYLSLPIVVTNLLQTAYNLVDTFWLGQYSDDALAAIWSRNTPARTRRNRRSLPHHR